MNKINKKISLLLCGCLIISILSACGKTPSDNSTEDSNGMISTESEMIDGSQDEDSTQDVATESPEVPTEDSNASTETEEKLPTETPENVPSEEPPKEETSKPQDNTTQTTPPSETKPSAGEILAKEIVDQIIKPGMSDFEKAFVIHDWITFNIDYDLSLKKRNLEETFRDRKGTCGNYAQAFEIMSNLAGLKCEYIMGEADNGGGYGGHAWNAIMIDNTWYYVDITWDDPTYEGKDPSDHSCNGYQYFLISEATIRKNHKPLFMPVDAGESPKDYDRETIYKYAANSGNHSEVFYANNISDAAKILDEQFISNKKEVGLWYYDTTITTDGIMNLFNQILNSSHVAYASLNWYVEVRDGLAQMKIKFDYLYDEWNSIPLVTNATELETLHNQMIQNGIKKYKFRYEPTNGEYEYESIMYVYYSAMEYQNTNIQGRLCEFEMME